MDQQVGFIGFGEAGFAIATGWQNPRPKTIHAFDIKTLDPASAADMQHRYDQAGVTGHSNLADMLANAQAIFSVVTADQAEQAAQDSAALINTDCLYCDCNSVAPGTKRRNAELIDAAGGRYVDVAVMAPVYPKQHLVPLLVSGPYAQDAKRFFDQLGMNATITDGPVGAASSVKMIRSIMVKGMEALIAQMLTAGVQSDVAARVLDSLQASFPGIDWRAKGAYDLERMMVHGPRRAQEMKEVVKTIHELGLPAEMAQATVAWQDRIGALELNPDADDYTIRARNILSAMGHQT